MQQTSTPAPAGMTAKQAKTVELAIVGVSLLSLVLLFQPFSLELYSVGAGLDARGRGIIVSVSRGIAGAPEGAAAAATTFHQRIEAVRAAVAHV